MKRDTGVERGGDEAVAQGVGEDAVLDPRGLSQAADHHPRRVALQAPAAAGEQQGPGRRRGAAAGGEVVVEGRDGARRQDDVLVAAALARTRANGDRVAAFCAALLVTQRASLADLASALGISIPAVRENLDQVAERLAPVGFSLTDDGGQVRLWPLPCAENAVRTLTDVEEGAAPSPEQLEILAIVAYFGQATRGLIEHFRQEESASLLQRLVERGLLAKVRDDHGRRPNVYSVTAKALRAAGFSTVEAMRAAVAAAVRPEEEMRLEAAMRDRAEEPARSEATGS